MIVKRLWADFHRVALKKATNPSEQPKIIGAIPLIAKNKAGDWSIVCQNLARTVRTVLEQDYPNLEVLICGQDHPDDLPEDSRIRFLAAPEIKTRKKSDKGEKIALMANDLAARYAKTLYVMILDADDLLHPGVFAYVARDNNGRGYVLDTGYLCDLASQEFALLAPETGHSFDKHCGSCALFAVDFSRPFVSKRYLNTMSRGHNKYRELADRFGMPLDPIPFPAALYVVNHGENARARRGVGDFKARLLSEQRITEDSKRKAIAGEFRLQSVD
jgi:hypothetical protein